MPENDWNDQIIAFLHDPPDKSLDIRGHERRALAYLEKAVGRNVEHGEIKLAADASASIAERLPMPTAGKDGERAVGPVNGEILICHPLSGASFQLPVKAIQKDVILQAIEDIVAELASPRDRFFVLWRMLPERLATDEDDHFFSLLPADTRVPDHTLWNHMDVTAALRAAENGGGGAFLSFTLGPVQEYIAAARTVRDLWTGSLILSWVTFQAMLPVIEQVGPCALVYPALRGLPWMDHWMREHLGLKSKIPQPSENTLCSPCLPNRFLALIPARQSEKMADQCRERALCAWQSVAEAVHTKLNKEFSDLSFGKGWDRRWQQQIDGYFDFRTAVFTHASCQDAFLQEVLGQDLSARLRMLEDELPAGHRPPYTQKSVGRWQALVDYSSRLMEATRTVSHIPLGVGLDPGEYVPRKCSLFGSYEQMGPDTLSESAAFWAEASQIAFPPARLRKNERFCAVALVKRFAAPLYFEKEMGLKRTPLFSDTATVSARWWLELAGIYPDQVQQAFGAWNGQWLHWQKPHQDDDMEAMPEALWKKIDYHRKSKTSMSVPAYYAALMLDGDQMGKWLGGEKGARVRDILHPKLREYFLALGEAGQAALQEKRPVGPALHAAISQALANFAVHAVPAVAEQHKGELIYAGGDDVLLLLPLDSALACAAELVQVFQSPGHDPYPGYHRHNGRNLLMMGPQATLSGGMAVVHHKHDLRQALNTARQAEKMAKRYGRNALMIAVCRRSGQRDTVLCPWDSVKQMEKLMDAFRQGASDRFAYHLAAETSVLSKLDIAAQRAEISRLLGRSEKESRRLITGHTESKAAGAVLVEFFDAYVAALRNRPGMHAEDGLENFVALLQTASFLARGRD